MFPKAPKVEVYAPTTLFTGSQVSVEVVIDAEEETKIEYVDARITGRQGWRIGSGKSAVSVRAEFPSLVARLREAGKLPAGTSRHRAVFTLPADMPPSHQQSPAWAWLEMYVRVAIPWWPDGKYRFTLPVRVPPPPHVARSPFALRSTAAADAPRLELSLASTNLIAGETVVGSLAVFHLDDRKPRDVDLTLVPSFKLHRGRRYYERRGETLAISVSVPAGGAGTSVPFRFRLPATMTPSFKTITHELAWWLVAKSGSFFGAKVELSVPLIVFDASAAARTERLVAAPRLTDQRIAGTFEQFAQTHGWQPVVDDDEPDQLLYEREVGDAALRLGYAYRGEAGAFLVARVGYPSLGLALAVTPSSRVRELFSKDIEVDLAAWDRGHHVQARSEVQTKPFLRAAVPSILDATKTVGVLRQWNDEEIAFERQVASVEPNDLVRASVELDKLAAQLLAAPIEPPAELDVDVHEWKQLARRLNGQLSPGDLTIDGTLEQRPVLIALEFEGERPTRVIARVGDPQAAVEQGELTDAERAELPAEFSDLQLVDGIASATMPLGRLDAARVKELVTALRALLARRDPNRGPYR